jgi:hypothetical protein
LVVVVGVWREVGRGELDWSLVGGFSAEASWSFVVVVVLVVVGIWEEVDWSLVALVVMVGF